MSGAPCWWRTQVVEIARGMEHVELSQCSREGRTRGGLFAGDSMPVRPSLAEKLRNLYPVINAKPFDALKFTDVIANKCQALTARMTSNHRVMKPNRMAGAFEICTNLAVMGCSSFAKRENVQACSKLVDDLDVFDLPCRFLRTIDDLGKSDGGDAKLIRKPVEPLAQPFGSILDDVDADVCIEHVAKHQKGSRSSAGGCRRSDMNSPSGRGPSKKISQD